MLPARLNAKLETGIVCMVDVDGREMEVVAQWRDAPARVNAASFAADNVNLKAEVARLRARVRVEAEDVERAGVTWAKTVGWLEANGWTPQRGAGVTTDGRFINWTRRARPYSSPDTVSVFDRHLPGRIAQCISTLARHHGRPGLDILDEMAARSLAQILSTTRR